MMLFGPCSSVVSSLSLSSLHSLSFFPPHVVSFCPVSSSFVLLLLLRLGTLLALACTIRLSAAFLSSLSLSFSLHSRLEDLLTRGPRVSRRALWWLLRWLLASLESSRECAPRGSRNSLGNRFTSFPASLYPFSFLSFSSSSFSFSLFLLSPFLTAPRITTNPPYAPSGSYLRVYLFSLITAVGM